MTGKLSLLVISFSDLSRDPRVNRQIRFLRDDFHIVCAGLQPPGIGGVSFVPLRGDPSSVAHKVVNAARLFCRRFESYYWNHAWIKRAGEKLQGVSPDAILANDLNALPLAIRLSHGKPVIYDAHEYSPRQFEDRIEFRLLFQRYNGYLCCTYIPQAAAMMTVGQGIADEYCRQVGVRPHVVLSAPDYEDLAPRTPDDETIRLIHHGNASRSRRIERMIELCDYLDERFELSLVLVETAPGYVAELKRRAAGHRQIRFLAPVPMPQIPRFLNAYDVGLAYFEPTTFNLRHVLPNKFFEFIQARLALAIGPSPEMQRIVAEHDLGVVADEFSPRSLAQKLNALSREDVMRYKSNADRVARLYSTETTRAKVLAIVEEALMGATTCQP
jgi:hypothetical protein